MKRTLSLVLALVMILGTFTTVFAATEAEKTAAEFLADEGILKGADGDLMLDKNLERRDAVVLLSRLLGVEEEAAEFLTTEDSPSWEDARTDAYYVPFFAWAQENGYFEGDDEGNFNPRNAITAPEYSLVLLRALGYEVNGHESWKASLETAEKIGLLKDVEVEFADLVVRGQMAAMTFNALGTKMNGSDETLAEFLGIEMPEAPKADKLTVEVLETENLAEVVVELSNADLIKDKEALTNPNNYRISETDVEVKETGVEVKHVDVVGDDVILTLVPYGEVEDAEDFKPLIKGRKFNLTIRNIHPDMNGTYKNILANDNTIPFVESVDFMGDYGIKVTTNEPIANLKERNFRLDSRTSMIVEQYGREIILTPYYGKAFDKDADELTVDKLEDFARYTSATTFEELELSSDDALPQVEAAYRSGDKLTVVFDRDVYHDSIEAYTNRRESGNVSFVERRVTFYAETAEKVDANVVVYTFEREIPRNIEVEISGVANHFKKAMEAETVVPVEYKDEYAPVIISHTEKVKITETEEARMKELLDGLTTKEKNALLDKGQKVNTQSMTITFDKDIAELVEFNSVNGKITEADLVDHFILYELDVTNRGKVSKEEVQIKVVADSVKKDEIKLTFEGIKLNNSTRDFDYVLEVRDFTDSSRNRMEREYLDFQVIRITDAFSAKLVNISQETYYNRNGVEITLKFNAAVNKEEASNHKNYYLDGKLAINEAIVERDGKTVSLLIYDKTVAKVYEDYKVLELSPRIVDLSSPAVKPAYRFFNLETKAAMPEVKPGTPVEEVELEALEEAIADVEALLVDAAKYTEDSVVAVKAALEAAKKVVANKDATKAEVEKALEDLKAVELVDKPEDAKVKATATSQSALGATKLVITVEGATGEEVEKVLVNGSEIAIQRVEGNDVTVLSASAVETVKIVVAGVEYSVTVTE